MPQRPRDSTTVVDGVVRYGGFRTRFEGSRFGYAIATLFGVRTLPPQAFVDGVITFGPDPALFQNIALIVLAAVVFAALAVGALAYPIGRYITREAIQPLVDVTEALSPPPSTIRASACFANATPVYPPRAIWAWWPPTPRLCCFSTPTTG